MLIKSIARLWTNQFCLCVYSCFVFLFRFSTSTWLEGSLCSLNLLLGCEPISSVCVFTHVLFTYSGFQHLHGWKAPVLKTLSRVWQPTPKPEKGVCRFHFSQAARQETFQLVRTAVGSATEGLGTVPGERWVATFVWVCVYVCLSVCMSVSESVCKCHGVCVYVHVRVCACILGIIL